MEQKLRLPKTKTPTMSREQIEAEITKTKVQEETEKSEKSIRRSKYSRIR